MQEPVRREYSSLNGDDLSAIYSECHIQEKGNLRCNSNTKFVEELDIDPSFYTQWEVFMSHTVRSVSLFLELC
jgi:hypothetical protein